MRRIFLSQAALFLYSPIMDPSGGTVPVATGVAYSPAAGTAQATSSRVNNFKPNGELRFTIANASGADKTDITIIAGAGDTEATLPASVTITSSSLGGSTAAAKLANLKEYFRNVGMAITGIKVSTTDPDNFDGALKVAEKNPNGDFASANEMNFDEYRQNGTAGVDNVLKVNDGKQVFTNNAQMRWLLTFLKDATSMTFVLSIPENTRNQTTTAIDY